MVEVCLLLMVEEAVAALHSIACLNVGTQGLCRVVS